ncbi:hypothetical protein BGP_3981 [Beggiatoa sp. PS]|nr:hypothetical protein BGP_3981 [Beggiatoa sp. PS]
MRERMYTVNEEAQSQQTDWHLPFGESLEWDLTPVGVPIYPEALVMSKPPRVDVLILRQPETAWTAEQLERLPDGIRQSTASHILLEFKYTESISDNAVIQTLAYDFFYKNSKQLTMDEVQTFLISAKKPQEETRKAYGYDKMLYPGVYESQNQLEKRIQLISLNELADEPYNAVFKLFATHRKEKQKAFELLKQSRDVSSIPPGLKPLLSGLLYLGEQDMNFELTPEQVREIGQIWGKTYLSTLSPEERLIGLKPEERFIGLKPEERLMGLKPEERLADLSIEEIEAYLKQRKKLN